MTFYILAGILTLLPQVLTVFAEYEQMVLGLVMLLVMIFLREGRNRVEIRSIREADTDYDDFEFTNVRIELEAAGARPL